MRGVDVQESGGGVRVCAFVVGGFRSRANREAVGGGDLVEPSGGGISGGEDDKKEENVRGLGRRGDGLVYGDNRRHGHGQREDEGQNSTSHLEQETQESKKDG